MHELTQEAVRKRLYSIKNKLVPQWEKLGQDRRILGIFDKWRPLVRKIQEESSKKPEVVISLVGGTGAGKSTLLNAILNVRLLPVSNMRACTAAITEVSYSQDGKYHAVIDFMTRQDWQKEINALKEDLKDYIEVQSHRAENSDTPLDEVNLISRVARDKIKTVYALPDDFEFSMENLRNLKEDDEIAQALDGRQVSVTQSDLGDFRKDIALYLDSKHKFWPIVTKVAVSGPFDILKDGVKIVDLPGINDPNQAREAVTHNYLKTCNFVWIIFNIKRVITKDTMALMQSDDFMRQILMDGRANALTFVGTASDDIDFETAREEFGLDENTTESQVILCRNQEVRKEVKKQIEDLAARMIQLAQEDGQKLRQLTETIRNSEIFTVSAHEYMRLSGIYRGKSIRLVEVSDTEIESLKKHLGQISGAYGIEAQARSHHNHIDLLVRELERETQLCIEGLEKKYELNQRQKQEVERAVHTARQFLEHELKTIRESYQESLESSQKVLYERLERGFERGKHDIVRLASRWQMMHWATLRAVTRRGGRFVGSSGTHDFSGDISEPILNTIMFAWAEFFGQQLTMQIERICEKLLRMFHRHLKNLLAESMKSIELNKEDCESFEKMFLTSGTILKEITGQVKTEMLEKIDKTRKTLYEQIEGQIDANMQSAYEKAAIEKGSGMKLRMVNILTEHAREVANIMFEDARREITQGIRSLTDHLLRKYDEMKGVVTNQSSIAENNLLIDTETLSPQDIQAKKLGFKQFIAILKLI